MRQHIMLWYSRASALRDTPVHQSWHVASQQSWPKPGWLLHLGHDAEASIIIKYEPAIRTSCGSGLLRHGLNFSTAWWTMQLISGSVHVSTQMMVTGHFEHLLWLYFLDIQVFIQRNRLFSQPPTFWGKWHTFHQMNKVCISQGDVVTFFRCDSKFPFTVKARLILR